jgi:serine/threonine protein kinase
MTYKTYEAVIDDTGQIRLLQTITCSRSTRALVIILEGEEPSSDLNLQPTIVSDAAGAEVSIPWSKRYRRVRELGSGGMGKTILAERISDGALVCLKFLHQHTNRMVLEQECRALLRLRHPAIIGLLDFSLEDTPPWLATEFATGVTLSDYLKERRALSPPDAVILLRTILEGLEHAHTQGVIHRDLKPANLIVDEVEHHPRLRILDFGIAIVDQLDHEGRLTAEGVPNPVGTMLYMAPEQMKSNLLTPACDVYAAGLIAWEMLMGKHPFQAKTPAALIYEKITPSGGYRLDPSLAFPPPLGEFVNSATQTDPEQRLTARQGLTLIEACGI